MNRYFTSKQKKVLSVLSEGLCNACGNPLPASWHADHIIPFSISAVTHISNGQALCPKCNLLKSNKMEASKQIVLRKWQAECFNKLIKVRESGRSSFLAVAGVGSGKTMFSCYSFNHLKKVGNIDSVIVVSPTENIKRNWSVTFQRDFGIKVDHGYQFKHGWPRDCSGISITYQSLNPLNLEILKQYVNRKVMLIVDEVHHAGDDKSWGNAISEIGEQAGFVLLLSGTPDRNDNSEIPFVTYKKIGEKLYQLESDYTYGYPESVKDRECCPVIFQRNESLAETINGYKKLQNEFPTPEIKRLYNNIISVKKDKSCYVYQTFIKANIKLTELNELRNENYAGLVVCNTIADAKTLYERIYENFGDGFAELVTSDDSDSSKKIERFKNSYCPWIISINMISEGVDIPRIRTIVYASNVTTMVRFMQVMGRGVRNPKHIENYTDECYMYIPEYKPLIENALSIENEIKHIRTELENENIEPKKKGGLKSLIQVSIDEIVLSATSEDSGNVYSGIAFSQSEDLDAVLLAKKYQVSKGIVLSMWKDILNIAGSQTNGFVAPEDRPIKLKTITEEKEELKRLIKNAVSRIHFDYGLEFRDIHNKLHSAMRKSSSLAFTLDEYKRKLELAKELYEKLKND